MGTNTVWIDTGRIGRDGHIRRIPFERKGELLAFPSGEGVIENRLRCVWNSATDRLT